MLDTLDTLESIERPALGDIFSAAIVPMIDRLQASIVQVRIAGRGMGAGVIWDAGGKIVTNHHVVAAGNMNNVNVRLTDGREFPAKVLGNSPRLDLALLSVEANDLPAANFADSSHLRVGELVFAIGHPWGVVGVVTAGIVSGLGEVRAPGSSQPAPYIRSDVRLAPGNSGGALLNAKGEVVGINSMVFGGDLGVAIPSHVTREWIAGLNTPKQRGYLGAGLKPVQKTLVLPGNNGSRQVAGLEVVSVQKDSPAAQSGLQTGDFLLEVGGIRVRDTETLLNVLNDYPTGKIVDLSGLRGGSVQTFQVKIGQK